MNTGRVLIETQFLPSLEFFCAIAEAKELQIEACEHFVKQSYRNHTFINTTHGVEKLTVPLASKGNRTVMKDVTIDGSQNWKKNQWRTIESAYRKSPYYEHYVDDLQKVIFSNHLYLIDLNFDLLNVCLQWLHWKPKLSTAQSYQPYPVDCLDLRNVLLSKKPYTTRNFYKPSKYTQVFGSNFVPNLSLLDLMFCRGPEAARILHLSNNFV